MAISSLSAEQPSKPGGTYGLALAKPAVPMGQRWCGIQAAQVLFTNLMVHELPLPP